MAATNPVAYRTHTQNQLDTQSQAHLLSDTIRLKQLCLGRIVDRLHASVRVVVVACLTLQTLGVCTQIDILYTGMVCQLMLTLGHDGTHTGSTPPHWWLILTQKVALTLHWVEAQFEAITINSSVRTHTGSMCVDSNTSTEQDPGFFKGGCVATPYPHWEWFECNFCVSGDYKKKCGCKIILHLSPDKTLIKNYHSGCNLTCLLEG